MAKTNNAQPPSVVDESPVIISEETLPAAVRDGRDIFAVNAAIRRMKQRYLQAAGDDIALAGKDLVLTLSARRPE